MSLTNPTIYTVGAVARRYGCPAWQIRRLFERGLLPPAARVGAYRVIAASDLPAVEDALRRAGYLPEAPPAPGVVLRKGGGAWKKATGQPEALSRREQVAQSLRENESQGWLTDRNGNSRPVREFGKRGWILRSFFQLRW